MNFIPHNHIVCFIALYILISFFKEIPAGTSAGDYDYSHRKRDCEITLVSPGGAPLPVTLIAVRQIQNAFAFGGTICGEAFDTLGDGYGESFMEYFDVATPENEMTWEYAMRCSEKCDPDFSKADSLISRLLEKKIPIRGHHLFSNEKVDLIPEWTRTLEPDAFKLAMHERIETAMGHFKGKVVQWDLINEICHGEDGSFPTSGMLETRSGDPDIFSWIMDEARKIDSVAEFVVSDYNLITSSDQTTADKYINKLKPLSGKFDIIGAEGHFKENMDKSTYESNINYLAEQLGKPVWLTEVDFNSDIDQVPDKIEELMRTCFANPNVGGLLMGSWCGRYRPRSDLTSYFVDSLDNETPVGERWRDVRAEWKTGDTAGYTDEAGKFNFNGFQGKYQIVISCYLDTFSLEPGEGLQTIEVTYNDEAAVNYMSADQKRTKIIINGVATPVTLPTRYTSQLFLTTYSLSGQQLSRFPVNPAGGKHLIPPAASFCRVFRIETADRRPLYTGTLMATH